MKINCERCAGEGSYVLGFMTRNCESCNGNGYQEVDKLPEVTPIDEINECLKDDPDEILSGLCAQDEDFQDGYNEVMKSNKKEVEPKKRRGRPKRK